MEEKKQPKVLKVDAIERGLHFNEDAGSSSQLDPEAYKKRLLGVMARDREIISSVLAIKKKIL